MLPAMRLAVPESGPIQTDAVFSWPVRDLWLEIGFGSGEHLAAQARAHGARRDHERPHLRR